MDKFTISLHHTRSTKGTHVFECAEAIHDSAGVTAIYIRKSAFANRPPPEHIVLTVDEDNTKT